MSQACSLLHFGRFVCADVKCIRISVRFCCCIFSLYLRSMRCFQQEFPRCKHGHLKKSGRARICLLYLNCMFVSTCTGFLCQYPEARLISLLKLLLLFLFFCCCFWLVCFFSCLLLVVVVMVFGCLFCLFVCFVFGLLVCLFSFA